MQPRQFRIRAQPGNGIVLVDYTEVDAIASGSYIVQPRDLPLYLIYPCGLAPGMSAPGRFKWVRAAEK